MNLAQEIPVLQQLAPEVREFVLRLLLLFVAVALIWILRRVLAAMIIRPLRILAGRTKSGADNKLLDQMIGPTRYAVMAFGLSLSVTVLDFGEAMTIFVNQISRTLFIVALFYAVVRVFDVIAFSPNDLLRFTGITIQERLLPFLRTAIRVVLITLALVIILQEWGFEINGLVASLGVVGLAFSLAAQDTVSNLFGFTAIVGDNPFQVGDFIVTTDVTGIVEHVGMRSTRIRQLDQALVTVPNSKLSDAAILNWSRLEKRWVNFSLGVTYTTTSSQMRELLSRIREMLAARETVDPDSVVVYFTDFGDSSLNILIRSYVALPDWGQFTAEKEQINLAVMDIVEELGLSIAFPSRSLYVESLPGLLQQEMAAAPSVEKKAREPEPKMDTSTPSAQPAGSTDPGDQEGGGAPQDK